MREVVIINTHVIEPEGSTPPIARHDPDLLPFTSSHLLFLKIHLNVILPSPCSSSGLSPRGFPIKSLYEITSTS
jgi:hypothetical protein